ncbi:hypothetical protein MFLAVUS_002513 [Mucor flavus]|uniref:Uncharacterized protein n=1 Tax=Mucor flavus TaxID=439312 RepID=A0ABP9YQI0_9FUNG
MSNLEIQITHSQAACIFYGDLLTTENQKLNEAKIAAIQDVELCYIDTPYKRYRHAELSSQPKLLEEAIEEVDNETKDNVIRKSLAELTYVSPQCLAGSPIDSRDMPNAAEELEKMELNYCAGSTQTLLSKLSVNIKKVCIAVVDYAGLSTNPDDIRTLVNCLECIVVDRFRETGKYEVYSRSKILNNDNYLKPFACRKALPHRSK